MLQTESSRSTGRLRLVLSTLFLLAALTVSRDASASPALAFSTYFGGTGPFGADFATAVEVDALGNVFVVGSTSGSSDLPTTPGVVQTASAGGDDIWLAKFDAAGSLLLSTYLGGSSNDNPVDLAVDGSGAVYLAGTTTSIDFPVSPGAIQPLPAGGSDAFVAKLSADFSSVVYATYLGGSLSAELASGIAVDAAGCAFVAGRTPSNDFPVTAGSYDVACGIGGNCTTSNEDVFVAKLNATGTALVYSTFVGGNKRDVGHEIVIDAAGNAYVVGTTASTDFPVSANAFDPTANGSLDGFLLKLNPTGSSLDYSTHLGGSGTDLVIGAARDAAGDLYLGGYTRSDDFPVTPGAFDTVCGSGTCSGSIDAFVLKIRDDGTPPIYSTYIGGSGLDFGFGLAVDDEGQANIGGTTTSPDFPLQAPIQGALVSNATCALDGTGIETGAPCSDLYVARLSADGSALLFSDYLGGSDGETRITVPSFNHNLALNAAGEIHVVGTSYSTDYPTANAVQSTLLGGNDAVITKLGGIPGSDTTPPTADAGPNQAIHAGDLVVLDGSGSFDDNTATVDLLFQWSFAATPAGSAAVLAGAGTSGPSFVADLPGTYLVELVVADEAGLVSAPDTVEVSSLNVSPVADAGLDQIVVVDAVADLNGANSSDGDGDPLTYSWVLASAPAGSTAAIMGAGDVAATLVPDLVGSYLVTLTVNDGIVDSAPDAVEITAITVGEFAEGRLLDACAFVSSLPLGAFDAPGHQNALCNFMSQAVQHIGQGKIAKAISKIDDTIARTDGCVVAGTPDPKGEHGADWLLDCGDQATLYSLLTDARDALD